MRTVLQTPTPDLEKSTAFYERLDFLKLASGPNPLFSDGKCLIEISPSRFARAGVKIYRNYWDEALIKKLETLTQIHNTKSTKFSDKEDYAFCDPSGTWIYLMNDDQNYEFNLESIPTKLGNSAGVSIETPNMGLSNDLWRLVGFDLQEGDVEKGWVSLTNEDHITISLMNPNTCPHLFFNPSLTYFNGKNNIDIIANLRALKIPITEEITHFNKEGIVDNIIIRDPGGLGFFLFSD